jgi:hypothetical protein
MSRSLSVAAVSQGGQRAGTRGLDSGDDFSSDIWLLSEGNDRFPRNAGDASALAFPTRRIPTKSKEDLHEETKRDCSSRLARCRNGLCPKCEFQYGCWCIRGAAGNSVNTGVNNNTKAGRGGASSTTGANVGAQTPVGGAKAGVNTGADVNTGAAGNTLNSTLGK